MYRVKYPDKIYALRTSVSYTCRGILCAQKAEKGRARTTLRDVDYAVRNKSNHVFQSGPDAIREPSVHTEW